MRNGKRSVKTTMLYAAALVLTVATVIAIGTAYAHYRSICKSVGSLELKYDYSSNGIWMLASDTDVSGVPTYEPVLNEGMYELPGGWTTVSEQNGIYTLSFLLSNEREANSPADFDQYGSLQVIVGRGALSSSTMTVSANVNGAVYNAVVSEIEEGTSLYEAYGEGWIYEFKNRNNERASWYLPGGVSAQIPVTLTVSGSSGYPVSVNLVATAKPAE